MEWQPGDGVKAAWLPWDGAAALGSHFRDGGEHSQGSRQGKGPPLALGVTLGAGEGHRQLLRDCWAPVPARCDHRAEDIPRSFEGSSGALAGVPNDIPMRFPKPRGIGNQKRIFLRLRVSDQSEWSWNRRGAGEATLGPESAAQAWRNGA